MACLCDEIAGGTIDLSPRCIGHLWIFQDLDPAEVEALSREALRKQSVRGQSLFLQGEPTDEMFLITHEDLGFLTGAHRVTITRAMKALRESGKILHEDRRLVLPAIDAA